MIDKLIQHVEKNKIHLIEDDIPIENVKGLYFDDIIVLSNRIETEIEKKCILAEELGHYETSAGNIVNQEKIENQKAELRARRWAVEELIKLEDFIEAFEAGIKNKYELAEFLEVTEDFLEFTAKHYQQIHGNHYLIDEYVISFSPLYVFKKF